MSKVKLIKETTPMGTIRVYLELNDSYVSGSMILLGDLSTPKEEVDRKQEESYKLFETYVENFIKIQNPIEVLREQDI
mgnify:CR=1 FL=1